MMLTGLSRQVNVDQLPRRLDTLDLQVGHAVAMAAIVGAPRDGARPTLFYGWYVALAVAAIAFVAWGVAFWNVGVFLYAFHEERGWSRSALSGGAALFSVVAGLTGLTIGRIVDRRGPRVVLLFGGLMVGSAMVGIGEVRELW